MNTKRLAVWIGATAGLVGVLSLGAFAAGAAGLRLPEPPRAPIQAAAESVAVTTSPSDSAEPTPTPTATLAAEHDPSSPKYNPYVTPGDSEFISEQERAEWVGRELVVQACMNEAGFEYLVDPWWYGGQAQPKGLDYETSILWLEAYYGGDPNSYDWQKPWQERGCVGHAEHEAEVAAAAGTPLTGPIIPVDPNRPTEREQQLAFQTLIAECMADAGFEYPVIGWWELPPDKFLTMEEMEAMTKAQLDPRIPDDFTEEQTAAWDLELWGNAGAGADYRWEDAGCDGYAVHTTGNDNMH